MSKKWLVIDGDGKVKSIDWDAAESLAEIVITLGAAPTADHLAALVAVSVREHVLECVSKTPQMTKNRSLDQPKSSKPWAFWRK